MKNKNQSDSNEEVNNNVVSLKQVKRTIPEEIVVLMKQIVKDAEDGKLTSIVFKANSIDSEFDINGVDTFYAWNENLDPNLAIVESLRLTKYLMKEDE